MRAHHVWRPRPAPLVIAHRGGAHEAPEHTIEAYESAVRVGADALELDVHATADGHLVVMHDPTLDRTTGGTGTIAELSLAELQTAAAGDHVPTLEEVLERFALPLIIDVKRTAPEVVAYEEAVVHLIAEHRRTDDVIIGSFHATALEQVRSLAPSIATSLPPEEVLYLWLAAHDGDPWSPPPGRVAAQVPLTWQGTRVVDAAFVAEAHRHGLLVQVWTIDEAAEVTDLMSLGVDGIITDTPSAVRQLVDELTSAGGGPSGG